MHLRPKFLLGRHRVSVVGLVLLGLVGSSLPATAQSPKDSGPAAPSSAPEAPQAKASSPPMAPKRPVDLRDFDPSTRTPVKRTENADVYEVDGSQVAVLHGIKVNWNDGGVWRPIDTRLQVRSDGRYHNASGPLDTSFASATGPGQLVSAAGDGWSVGFSLAGADPDAAAVVSKSTVTYREVGPGPGVDLEYQVGAESFKELIVLNRPLAADVSAQFTFPLTLTGVEPRAEADGSIGFHNEKRERVAVIPPGLAWDSSAATPADAATAPVSLRLIGEPGAWAIQVEAPSDWVHDPARVWPLHLDPTFTAGQANDGRDAFDSSACQSCTYNNAAQFDAQFGAYVNRIGYSAYPSDEHYTYLKFDLGAVSGKQITASELRFYTFAKAHPGNWFWMKRADETWEDYSVSRDDLIDHSGEKAVSTAADGTETGIDVTDWTTGWAATPSTNYGVVMNTNGLNGYARIGASEQKYNGSFTYPRLIVGFNTRPNVPDSMSPTSGWTGPWAPELSARFTDPDGDSGNVDFEITGPNGFYNFQPVGTTNGGTARYTPALGNGTYSWRVRAWDGQLHSLNPEWSSTRTFTVTNQPPVADTLSPEGGWWSATAPTLSTRYFDAEGQAGTVDFEISGLGIVSSINAASTATVTHTPAVATGTYSWRAHARNAQGASVTEWRTFTVSSTMKLFDTWSLPNGSNWLGTKWAASTNGSGRTTDIQNGQGRFAVTDSSSRATGLTELYADAKVLVTYSFSDRNPGSDLRIALRAQGATGANQMPNSYRLDIQSGSSTIKLRKVVNGTAVSTPLGQFTHNAPLDLSQQRARLWVKGSAIKVAVWPAEESEPDGWDLEVIDTTITGGGQVQITHTNSSTTSRSVYIDNLTMSAIPASALTPDDYFPDPGSYNGKKVFLSPAGHEPDKTGCDGYSENTENGDLARRTAERLRIRGFYVRLTYGNFEQNAAASKQFEPAVHVPIHSNAKIQDPCIEFNEYQPHSPTGGKYHYGGTWTMHHNARAAQGVPETNEGVKLADAIFAQLHTNMPADRRSPGTNDKVCRDTECSVSLHELAASNLFAGTVPAYVESGYHDYRADKDWLLATKYDISERIAIGIDNYLGNPRCTSPCPQP